jgi:hypothetical protein
MSVILAFCAKRAPLKAFLPAVASAAGSDARGANEKFSSLAWSHTHTAPLIRLFAAFLRIKRALSKVMIAKMNDALL